MYVLQGWMGPRSCCSSGGPVENAIIEPQVRTLGGIQVGLLHRVLSQVLLYNLDRYSTTG